MPNKLNVGVDISKDWIDVAIHDQTHTIQLRNTTEAITAWFAEHPRRGILHVCHEATGGYERPLETVLRAHAIPFQRVPAHRLTAFRRAHGVQAKTDQQDARLLALFGAQIGEPAQPMPEADPVLRERVMRRRQLLDMRHAEACRRPMAEDAVTLADIEASIAALDQRIQALDRSIAAHIRTDPKLHEAATLMRSFIGVGALTVAAVLGQLPELGHCDEKRIAALVGLAPRQSESGRHRGRATTGHGRPEVRRVLFNAARSAIRHNPAMRAVYERLTQVNGRPGKVALVAVMRRILVILNAMMRDRTPWKGALAA